jgi:ribosomal protection tetracycline resistance protein
VCRAGARKAGLLDGIRRRLTRYVVQLVGVRGLGTARARLVPRPLDETAAGTLAEVDTDVPTCWTQLLPRWELCGTAGFARG